MANDESAFGRPPQWRTALPAVVIGTFALGLALYGRYVLPSSLPPRYAKHLQQSAVAYEAIRSVSSLAGGSKLVAVAGERDVVFERLVSLEKGSPERYWEWFAFLDAHSQYLREQLADRSVSISERYREPLQGQADLFNAKAEDILKQLAATDSQLKQRAVLRLSQRQYEQGLNAPSAFAATKLMQQLQPLVDSETSPLNEIERKEAEWLLVASTIDAAWQQTEGSRLHCDASLIAEAGSRLDAALRTSTADESSAPRWQALRQLVQIYSKASEAELFSADEASFVHTDNQTAWPDQLAQLQLAACRADWQDVEYLLPSSTASDFEVLASGLARTCCRLVCSEAAHQDAAWAEPRFPAVLLAGRLSPQLPEFSELLWLAGQYITSDTQEPESNGPRPVLASSILQLMLDSSESWLPGTLQALSASFAGDTESLRLSLDKLRESPGGTHLVARVALWRSQALDEGDAQGLAQQLTDLLQATVAAEPKSGLNRFALGVVQFKLQDFDASEQSLEEALELTSGAAAVKEALNAVKAARNRMGNR